MNKLQKRLLAGAVTLALGASSAVYGASTIFFDQTGGGGAGVAVDSFDWLPGNALAVGALNTVGTTSFELFAQAKLSNFVGPGQVVINVAGGEFTLQVNFTETATLIGGPTIGLSAGPDATSTFTIYRDTVADSDPITGLGYGASGTSVAILTGTLFGATGSFTNQTILNGLAPVLLDQLNVDNQNGTLTHAGSGSTTLQINVGFADPNFFRSSVTTLLVDLQDTNTNAIPFQQVDPSNVVFGQTPSYTLAAVGGPRVNGLPNGCAFGGQTETGTPTTRCDIHLQTDGTTSFNPTLVPEPGTLSLFALAIGALGLSRRRWARS